MSMTSACGRVSMKVGHQCAAWIRGRWFDTMSATAKQPGATAGFFDYGLPRWLKARGTLRSG
ncbi:MAG: hypothetical protein DMG61_01795 [Acidobacteria bacterium]|nr:MAG: hypothetical protein DMG61_01795 [Acidobacteriota bacterium]